MNIEAPKPRVGVLTPAAPLRAAAERLSEETGAPLIARSAFEREDWTAALLLDEAGLALAPSPTLEPHVGPIRIDVREWEELARRPVSLKQPLARAVGIPSRASAPAVLDCTAGVLSDAFHLALMGCRVIALERSPVVYALAADALQRAAECAALVEIVSRISLMRADAREFFDSASSADLPPVVFIDPMHPPRDRHVSALVRKEMRILRLAVGDDLDAPALLSRALARLSDPRSRVVLKLPLRAQPFDGAPAPAHVHEAKTVRYEVHKPVHAQPASSR